MWSAFLRIFSVESDDLELVSAQFKAFAKQIPLLYFILCVNALAVGYTFFDPRHLFVTVVVPAAMILFCGVRGVIWRRRSVQNIAPEAALRMIRSTFRLAALIAVAYMSWGFALYYVAQEAQRAQVAFFLGLTMISCVFCLTQVRAATLIVATIGVLPFTVFFSIVDGGHLRAIAFNLAFVIGGVMTTVLRNYRDFKQLVYSQRALMEQHRETLRLSEENRLLAYADPLTGLANRRAFLERAGALTQEAREVAVAFVDLDGFKSVNDELGHETGDALLQAAARALAALLPEGALLARLGGDEFAVILASEAAEDRLAAFAEGACAQFREPFAVGGKSAKVGASFGVAGGALESGELLRRADVAMYQVKLNGKLGVLRYTPDLDAARRGRNRLCEEIEQGLARDEFEMFYQPIVDAETREIVCLEALMRWPRRPGGPLGPDAFIPAAEAGGQIRKLGLFALRRACEDLLRLPDLDLSVNVSPAQLRDADFPNHVAEILATTGMAAQRLRLELTERHLIEESERSVVAIEALKRLGVRVALDDFGVGYTSIAYLQKYGFDAIKIDRSLVSRLGSDARARVLVTGVVYLANGLDMAVTAEGVETEEQATLLRLAGCKTLQGFRFHRPAPLSEWRGVEAPRAATG